MKGEPTLILLVEDDPAHAEITRRNLDASGIAHRLIHLDDGQAALDYLFRRGRFQNPSETPRPHLILLDLRLPKVEGLEVLRRVKGDDALREVPVVVLTTSAAPADIADAYRHSASSYLIGH